MKIDIVGSGPEIDKQLNHFASCCAAFELGPQKENIESLRISLTGADEFSANRKQTCLVEVGLSGGHSFMTRDEDLDMHIAIYRALEHAGWMTARWLSEEDIGTDKISIPLSRAGDTGQPNWAA